MMKKMRIVMCDDNREERLFYEKFTRELGKKYNTPLEIKTYASGEALVKQAGEEAFISTIDLVYLNINLPGSDGIEITKELRRIGYMGLVIFFTELCDRYEQAFDVRGFNYITKNQNVLNRFERVFLMAVNQVKANKKEAIVLTGSGRHQQIIISQIKYFEVMKNLITVYYGKTFEFTFVSTLKKLEIQLANRGFHRCHKSFLVNLSHIREVSAEYLVLWDGTKVPVGRRYYPELKDALKEMASVN